MRPDDPAAGGGLRVRSADHLRPLILSIAGTVLVCRELWWTGETTWHIPIEWVKVRGGRRREHWWLHRSLLIFVALLAGSVALGAALERLALPLWPFSLLMASAFLSLPATLWLWLRHRPTFVLELEHGEKKAWEFFAGGDPHSPQRRFVEDLLALQARIRDLEPFAARWSFVSRAGRRWRELVPLTFLFLLPAWITEYRPLLWLGLLPLAWGGYQELRVLLQPGPLRRAVRDIRRGRHEEARGTLRPWVEENPGHLLALDLLWGANLEAGCWDEALEVARRVHAVDPVRAREMEEDTWIFRRIRERMQRSV